MLDDSTSYALTEDGWIEPPRPGHQDLYFFSYGYAYRQALADFFHLCGPTPLLPRYALGKLVEPFSCLHGRRIPLPHGPV